MRFLKVSAFLIVLALLIALGLYNNVKSKEKKTVATDVITSVPVKTTKITKSAIESSINLSGMVAANADIMMVSETQGRVVAVNAKTGDYMQEGADICKYITRNGNNNDTNCQYCFFRF